MATQQISSPPLMQFKAPTTSSSSDASSFPRTAPPLPPPPTLNSITGNNNAGICQQQQQQQHLVPNPVVNHHGAGSVSSSTSYNQAHRWGRNSSPVFEAAPPFTTSNIPEVGSTASAPLVIATATAAATSDMDKWSVANSESCPNFSVGTTKSSLQQSSSSGAGGAVGGTAAGRRRYGKACETAADSVNARRQKRLERNRESARLSRRRRKQYLEVLEDRVTQLSMEMDKGRREHVGIAVGRILNKRREALEAADRSEEERIFHLDMALNRTHCELRLANTFKVQQLKSFSLPQHSKFYMWLTLQSDSYFRGGRAASERLSAARIGERMLNNGNDKVPPAGSMWPLFCNEVGLSYDQEERVRNIQRSLLQSDPSWVERHTAHASHSVTASLHDATQALSVKLGSRERSMLGVLTTSQRLKFLSWAERNRVRISRIMNNNKIFKTTEKKKYNVHQSYHTAANLYILNYRLEQVLKKISRARSQVTGAELKKLSRRPSFESLGRAVEKQQMKDENNGMEFLPDSLSGSSLKRSTSTVSIDEQDRMQVQQINAEEAEAAAAPAVEKCLGFVTEIIPPIPAPEYVMIDTSTSALQLRIPSPTHVTSAPLPRTNVQPSYSYVAMPMPTPIKLTQNYPTNNTGIQQTQSSPMLRQHEPLFATTTAQENAKASFLPPHLNVVPEEMFPSDATEDFLMNLVADEDWAIGGGIDMDTI